MEVTKEFIEDVKELFDIFIEGGYAEAGDGPLLDRLHEALNRTKAGR